MGDKDSYPHDQATLVRALPPGNYLKAGDETPAKVKLSLAPDGKYTATVEDNIYEAGFYPNDLFVVFE